MPSRQGIKISPLGMREPSLRCWLATTATSCKAPLDIRTLLSPKASQLSRTAAWMRSSSVSVGASSVIGWKVTLTRKSRATCSMICLASETMRAKVSARLLRISTAKYPKGLTFVSAFSYTRGIVQVIVKVRI